MSRRALRRLALVLTALAVLQGATMVHAALTRHEAHLAFTFFTTGALTLLLAAAARYTWTAAREARDAPGPAVVETEPTPGRRHTGLSGDVPPPRRW